MKVNVTIDTEMPLNPTRKTSTIPVMRRKQVQRIIIPFLEAPSWLKEHEHFLDGCW
jgi:hypothetical protein